MCMSGSLLHFKNKSPDIFLCPAMFIHLIKGGLQPLAKRKSFPFAVTIIQYPPWKLFNGGETKTNFH